MANKRTAKKSAKKEVTKAAFTPVVAEGAKAETTAAAPAVEKVKVAPVEKAPRARKTAEKKAFMLPLQLRDISEVLHITQINFMLISRYLQTEHLYIRTVNLYIPGQCL